jgi:hypothetical protein
LTDLPPILLELQVYRQLGITQQRPEVCTPGLSLLAQPK